MESSLYSRGVMLFFSISLLQMYDSSAKLSAGIITGNILQLGNYDECLRINTGRDFVAQACSASVRFEILKGQRKTEELDMKDLLLQVAKASNLKTVPEKSVGYEWMWCVPSTCNHSEISEAIELALDPLKVDDRLDFVVNVNANSCQTIDSRGNSFDSLDWFYTGVLLAFLILIVASTCYDLYVQSRMEDAKRREAKHLLLTSFSSYTHGKQLLSTRRGPDSIKCLDGLRYLSICWIIFGHTYYAEAVGVKLDRSSIPKLHENLSSMLILNGNIVTDTFFLLSGILLAYVSLTKGSKEKEPSFNIFQLYLNRYLRLTPAYAIVIGFYATFLNELGSGPKWNAWITKIKQDCRANWWTNLLYVNNYVNVKNTCMTESWYLGVDMQLLWMSPIFLYPMLKFNRKTYFWTVTGVGLVASVLLPFFITYFMQLTATMLYYKNSKDVLDVYLQIYTRVYTRMGPYIIGLVVGYVLFKTKNYKIKIKPVFVCCLWMMVITVGSFVILLPRRMYYDDYIYSKWEASFYAGFHRHIFALAISWIIFACVNGYGGPLNAFLSWRAWGPLSRLTYSAYLSHYSVIHYNAARVRTSSAFTTFDVVHSFFGNLCLTMFISLFLSCFFEMPFMTLGRLLLQSPQRSRNSANLDGKTSAERIFESTDCFESMGRSREDIAPSNANTVECAIAVGKNHNCVNVESSKDDKTISTRVGLGDFG